MGQLIQFDSRPGIDQVMHSLSENGVLVINNYASSAQLEKLTSEYRAILSGNRVDSQWFQNRPYSLGVAALVDNGNELKTEFPVTASFFSDAFMQKVTNSYMGKGFHANQKIFVVKDIVGTSHKANDLHFDVQRTLKFFLYLTDTSEKNGAFRCVPASHKVAQRIRLESPDQISYENREFTRQLPFSEKDAVSVNGKAGSLIIFDTDVFHQAGKVTEGERWVMRGQTEAVGRQQVKLSILQRLKNKLKLQ